MDTKRRPPQQTRNRVNTTNPKSDNKRLPQNSPTPAKRPFNIYTKSSSIRRPRDQKGNVFADYSMTNEELRSCEVPADGQMRRPSSQDYSAILHNPPDPDARKRYLEARSAETPREKYFYPEATSYRYGWVTKEDVRKLSGNVKLS